MAGLLWPQLHKLQPLINPTILAILNSRTAQISRGKEATVTSVIRQSAARYLYRVATTGSSSNPSALPDDAINIPPYYVEYAPDEVTNYQSFSYDGTLTLSSPDYASVVSAGVSVPVPSVDII